MSAEPTLLIMAAGIGSRFGGLKQTAAIGPSGEMVLDYTVFDALKAGFGRVVFVIRREIEHDFRERVGRRIESRADTAYAFQELDSFLPEGFFPPPERAKPWGTGHAVLCARNVVDAPFAVVNADDFYGASAFEVLAGHLREARDSGGPLDFCMAGYVLENTLSDHGHVSRGICRVSEDGCLSGIRELTKVRRDGDAVVFSEDGKWAGIPPDSLVSLNTWGFTPGLFPELGRRFERFLKERSAPKAEYFLPSVVDELIREGKARVRVLRTSERWFGVTYREDLPVIREAVRSLVDRGVYPARLWS